MTAVTRLSDYQSTRSSRIPRTFDEFCLAVLGITEAELDEQIGQIAASRRRELTVPELEAALRRAEEAIQAVPGRRGVPVSRAGRRPALVLLRGGVS